jgi:prophage tail gpP-like protein
MTTLKKNISHEEELDQNIEELISLSGKKISNGEIVLPYKDIDRSDKLNLCRSLIELGDRCNVNTFFYKMENIMDCIVTHLNKEKFQIEGKSEETKENIVTEIEDYLLKNYESEIYSRIQNRLNEHNKEIHEFQDREIYKDLERERNSSYWLG